MFSGVKHIPQGINSEGLKRRGFSSDDISAVKKAYKILYRQGNTFDDAIEKIAELSSDQPAVKVMSDFLATANRGIAR